MKTWRRCRPARRRTRLWQALRRTDKAGDAQRWLSRLHWVAGHKLEAEHHANQAIALLSELAPGHELAMAFSNKSQLHMLAWEEAPAIEWGERAIALAERLGDDEILVHALTNVGSAGFVADFDAGEALLLRALAIARGHEMHDHAARCYSNLVSAAVQLHLYAKAQHWLEEGLAYTTGRDVDYHSTYLRGWQAQLFFEQGRWAEAEAMAPAVPAAVPVEQRRSNPGVDSLGTSQAPAGRPGGTAVPGAGALTGTANR